MANNLEMSNPRIAVAAPTLNGNEKRYVLECLETTWISSIGRFITEFERAFRALLRGRARCRRQQWNERTAPRTGGLRPQARGRSHCSKPYLRCHGERRDLLRRQAGAR